MRGVGQRIEGEAGKVVLAGNAVNCEADLELFIRAEQEIAVVIGGWRVAGDDVVVRDPLINHAWICQIGDARSINHTELIAGFGFITDDFLFRIAIELADAISVEVASIDILQGGDDAKLLRLATRSEKRCNAINQGGAFERRAEAIPCRIVEFGCKHKELQINFRFGMFDLEWALHAVESVEMRRSP